MKKENPLGRKKVLTKLSSVCKVGNMETKKATLTVNGNTFYVNYLGPATDGTCRVTLDWDNPRMGISRHGREYVFNRFIKCIGFPSDRWYYSEDAHEVFWIPSYGITIVEPETTPPVREETEAAKRLRIVGNRLENGFAQGGLQLVRVEYSQDMNEGTITLHYKKEEA